MKQAIILLVLSLILFSAMGQKLRNKGFLPVPVSFSSGNNALTGMDADRYAVLSRFETENRLSIFNTDHVEQFSISLESTSYYPLFKYVPELDAILVFANDDDNSVDSKKNMYRCIVSLYSAVDGKLIREEVLQNAIAEPASIYYSENNQFFCLDNSNLPGKFDMYRSSDFQKLNTFGGELEGHESVVTILINNTAESLLVLKNQNSYLFFNFYDGEGNLKNSVEGGRDLQSNQAYHSIRFKQNTDENGLFVFARSSGNHLNALDIWKVDFRNANAQKVTTFELTKENIRNTIYNRTYTRAELDPMLENYGNTPVSQEKGPSKLKNVDLNSIHLSTNGGLVVVLEEIWMRVGSRDPAATGISDFHRIENTNYYTGKDVMVIGFDSEGEYKWACAYERRSATKSSAYGQYKSSIPTFSPDFSGVETVALSDKKRLHLINFEYRLMGRYGPYYRSFDMDSGELHYDRPLLEEDKHTVNSKYVDIVGDNCMVLLTKTGIDFYITPEKLQLISVDLP